VKILVVDDEKDIVDLVSYNLEKEGFKVLKAYDGETALRMVQTKNPDLVILDLMLPGLQGLDVCKAIRGNPRSVSLPIIMLTAKGEEVDRVLGLEMGADDYVAKPFSVRELSARVRAIFRRLESRKEPEKETFSFRGLHVDYGSCDVSLEGRKIDLSPTEMKLLFFFSRHPGRAYTRDQILDHVWGDTAFVTPRTVDVHVRRLRAQIEKDLENPRFILTVRGIGYKFADSGS
jgi:two-component system alkaline phosphatase synthesis response regulator PhoP